MAEALFHTRGLNKAKLALTNDRVGTIRPFKDSKRLQKKITAFADIFFKVAKLYIGFWRL